MEENRLKIESLLVKTVLLMLVIALIAVPLTLVIVDWRQTNSEEASGDQIQRVQRIHQLLSQVDLNPLAEYLDESIVIIPAGEFIMGSNENHENERPQRIVYLDSFEIDRFEVTNVQYQRFLIQNDRRPPQYWDGLEYPTGSDGNPVAGVGWRDAQAYCEWLGKRLPTEAEWEKACRGTSGLTYPWGKSWDYKKANTGYAQRREWPVSLEAGWFLLRTPNQSNNKPGLKIVGSFPMGSSPYGIQDMVGNVSEWVADWYNWDGYWDLPLKNPVSLGPPWNHIVRGSAWFDRHGQGELIKDFSRCSTRNSSHSYDDPRIGFRCARSLD